MKIDNNISFTGIKLSHSDVFSTREIVKHLKRTGFSCFGKKTYNVVSYSDKRFVFEDIRYRNDFSMRNFGVVFLPEEAYIISSPSYEQLLLPVIKQYDKGAGINLLF